MAVNQPRNVSYGLSQPLVNVFPFPIVAQRAPAVNDRAEIGTIWIDQPAEVPYILVRIANNTSIWLEIETGGGAGVFTSLTVTQGPISLTSLQNAANTILIRANGGAAETIHIVSDQGTSATSVNIESVSGGITVNADLALNLASGASSTWDVVGAGQNLTLSSGGGNVIIDADGDAEINSTAGDVELSAVAGSITMSSSTSITMETMPTDGNIIITPFDNTVNGTAITINSYVGLAEFTGQVTPSMMPITLTITNANVTVGSGIFVSVSNDGANDAQLTIYRVEANAGDFTVTLFNNGAAALNGNIYVTFMVLA